MSVKLSKVTGITPDRRTHNKSKNLVLSRCRVGIEVELEGVPQAAHLIGRSFGRKELWNIVPEGGLHQGIEFVSKTISGADIETALNELNAFVGEECQGAYVTGRAGLHVHMDVRSWDTEQLLKFYVIYLIFEHSLFRHCGTERRGNPYCVPHCDSPIDNRFLSYLVDPTAKGAGDQFMGIREGGRDKKYQALNILPMFRQGSLEFRHHPGTFNPQEILQWINIIFCLRKYALEFKGNDLQSMIDRVCPDHLNFFREVFGPHMPEYDSEMLLNDMKDGARVAQSAIVKSTIHNRGKDKVTNQEATDFFFDKKMTKSDRSKEKIRQAQAATEDQWVGEAITTEAFIHHPIPPPAAQAAAAGRAARQHLRFRFDADTGHVIDRETGRPVGDVPQINIEGEE